MYLHCTGWGALELIRNPVSTQLVRKALLIGGFQLPRPQVTVNFDRTANHSIGEAFKFHLRALRVLRGDLLRF